MRNMSSLVWSSLHLIIIRWRNRIRSRPPFWVSFSLSVTLQPVAIPSSTPIDSRDRESNRLVADTPQGDSRTRHHLDDGDVHDNGAASIFTVHLFFSQQSVDVYSFVPLWNIRCNVSWPTTKERKERKQRTKIEFESCHNFDSFFLSFLFREETTDDVEGIKAGRGGPLDCVALCRSLMDWIYPPALVADCCERRRRTTTTTWLLAMSTFLSKSRAIVLLGGIGGCNTHTVCRVCNSNQLVVYVAGKRVRVPT